MNAPVNSPSTAPPAAPPQDPEAEKLERVEFYAASVAAWYATALEFDKTMITLSAAAIGLLGALATTGVTSLERWETYAFSAAIVSFSIALGCILSVFRLNQSYLVELAQKRLKARLSHPHLARLDLAGLIFFGFGATLTIVVAVSTIQKKLSSPSEAQMSEKADSTKRVPVFDSVNKALAMHPDFGKSFNGAHQLQPQDPATAPTQAAAAPASSTPAAPAPGGAAATGSK